MSACAWSGSGLYSREYFLSDCEGFVQYNASRGRVLSPRLKKIFALGGCAAGARVLDIGCGRGELVLHAAASAARGIGIDRSSAAIDLSRDSLRVWSRKEPGIKERADFIQGDCASLPFLPGAFDVVFLSDIIEHLRPPELEKTLSAVQRVLKPQGKAVVHSSPNRLFMRYGLRLYSFLGRLYGKKLPWDMRSRLPAGCQKGFHCNEQTVRSLAAALRKAGFRRINLRLEKNPQYIYYFFKDDSFIKRVRLLHALIPVKHFFCADIYGVAVK